MCLLEPRECFEIQGEAGVFISPGSLAAWGRMPRAAAPLLNHPTAQNQLASSSPLQPMAQFPSSPKMAATLKRPLVHTMTSYHENQTMTGYPHYVGQAGLEPTILPLFHYGDSPSCSTSKPMTVKGVRCPELA